ncbi:patatin-like phospholipase family protein [Solimonas marina]|uniref:Patatin-like phospholipase family protein n=1 Tax=Solimonas marina TaxID=2714601 RepID=A0A969W7W1_9GAMM|nr:patatin-like phospholipase family protein [Solimonas marina]NKF21524.1 patatin-like phospholipase family protein [Solimonas marina]
MKLLSIRPLAFLLLAVCAACATKPPEPTPAPPAPPPPPPKVALVLGGGGARGFAHIGVLKMLAAQGLKPDLIVGTSAGSVAGALYAAGYNAFDLQEMAFALDRATIADWSMFGKGLIRGDALEKFVNKAVRNRPIEALDIPFACVATRLDTGKAVLFQRGNVGAAVRASSSVPGVFAPAVIDGHEYVDGGLVAPVPIQYAKQLGADFIIAVDVSTPVNPSVEPSGKLDILMRTFEIMGQSIRAAELPQADIVIQPDLTGISSSNFESKQQAILQGERAALAAMPQIRAKLGERMSPHLPTTIPFQPGLNPTAGPRTAPSTPPPALE